MSAKRRKNKQNRKRRAAGRGGSLTRLQPPVQAGIGGLVAASTPTPTTPAVQAPTASDAGAAATVGTAGPNPQRALVLFQAGMELLRLAQFDDALHALQQSLADDPQSAATHSAISLAEIGRGEYAAAQRAVAAARKCGLTICAHQHGMGTEYFKVGDYRRAEACFRLAVEIQPELAETHNNLGTAVQHQGRLEEAVQCYDRALAIKPAYAMAIYNRGVALKCLGKLDEAAAALEAALQLAPGHVDALCNLGKVAQLQNRPADAVGFYQAACERDPDNFGAAYCLGVAHMDLQQWPDAERWLSRSAELNPDYAMAHNNLGTVRIRFGWEADAIRCFERALEIDPEFIAPQLNLGDCRARLGDVEAAIASYDRALSIDADHLQALVKKGQALSWQERNDDAEACFQQARRKHPKAAEPLAELGVLRTRRSRPEEAIPLFDEGLRLAPQYASLRYLRAVTCPVLYDSVEQIDAVRNDMQQRLESLLEDGVRLDPLHHAVNTAFYPAYHGRNDRELQTMIGQLWKPGQTLSAKPTAERDGRIRVGFLSRYLSMHTVGVLSGGLLAHLDRQHFHVSVFSLKGSNPWFQEIADDYFMLQCSVPQVATQVLAHDLDVLVYPEVGMDPQTNLLARLRLAPTQCVMWGHPVTTGCPEMDYFLSSQLLEPEGAADHYSETLVTMRTLPAYYYRPQPPGHFKSRAELGLPETRIYACPQSLFKFHPEFDAYLDGILREDPECHIVLLEGAAAHWHPRLQTRFARTLSAPERVIFKPRMDGASFMSLLRTADALLDPLHFGGGRSNYQAMSMGTPLVTQPGAFMRGRVALGLYRQMGIDECITDSRDAYVAKVIQIGRDREYREHLSRTICERSMAVLDDMQAVREFQDFLHFVAAQPERPTRPGQQRKPSEREQDEPAARPDSK